MKKVAVIGCGGWGRNHLKTFDRLGALGGFFDLDPARRASVATTYPGAKAFATLSEAAQSVAIDGAVIATPPSSHCELATLFLDAGKGVLVEKPLALSEKEGETLAGIVGDRVLLVGHVLEYHPAFVTLLELARSGELGEIRHIECHRLSFGKIRDEENVLWSFAPHDISMALRFFDEEPVSVTAHGAELFKPGLSDRTYAQLAFSRGRQARIHSSWISPRKEQRIVVTGTRQIAVFDDVQPWESKLVLHPYAIETDSSGVRALKRAEEVRVALTPAEPLEQEARAFLEAMESGQAPYSDAWSGVKVLRVLAAAQRSMDSCGALQTLNH